MPPISSGAVAARSPLHAEIGYEVTVVCMSFGERGESARLWKDGKTLDEVKAIRRAEAEAAAKALGVHRLECFDLGGLPVASGAGGQKIVSSI